VLEYFDNNLENIIGFAWCNVVLVEAKPHHTHLAVRIVCPMTTVCLHNHNRDTNSVIFEAIS
jgi:hypothetical protein